MKNELCLASNLLRINNCNKLKLHLTMLKLDLIKSENLILKKFQYLIEKMCSNCSENNQSTKSISTSNKSIRTNLLSQLLFKFNLNFLYKFNLINFNLCSYLLKVKTKFNLANQFNLIRQKNFDFHKKINLNIQKSNNKSFITSSSSSSSFKFSSKPNHSSYSTFSLFKVHHNLSTMFQTIIFLLLLYVISSSDACSARSTPKPRPQLPETRPNITYQTYQCPEDYAKWYCLNGASCFSVQVGESFLYNCECTDGYMGQRCEFKYLNGSYSSQENVLVETAKVAGGVFTVFVLFVFMALIYYANCSNKHFLKSKPIETPNYFNL